MNTQTARRLLPCCRPSRPMDPKVSRAAEAAVRDSELAAMLDEQAKFDANVLTCLHRFEIPETIARLDAVPEPEPKRHRVLHGTVVALVMIGILSILSIAGYVLWQRRTDFPGRDDAEDLITSMQDGGAAWEEKDCTVGDLPDWMFISGFDGFDPGELAKDKVEAVRVTTRNQRRVAEVVLPERKAMMFVVKATDFGISPGAQGQWRPISQGEWVGAVREKDGLCTILALRGTKEALHKWVEYHNP